MNIYYNLKNIPVKKKIAKEFGLQVKPFESWMSIVTLTRNACCHHSRIWNKQNTMLATEPKHITRPWINLPTDKLRIYFDICIIKWFLDCISPNNTLKDKICKLLADYPCIDISRVVIRVKKRACVRPCVSSCAEEAVAITRNIIAWVLPPTFRIGAKTKYIAIYSSLRAYCWCRPTCGKLGNIDSLAVDIACYVE